MEKYQYEVLIETLVERINSQELTIKYYKDRVKNLENENAELKNTKNTNE